MRAGTRDVDSWHATTEWPTCCGDVKESEITFEPSSIVRDNGTARVGLE
jgi:hypothetical protein